MKKYLLILLLVTAPVHAETATVEGTHAAPTHPTTRARAVLNAGMICVNEAGWNSRADCEAIWHATLTHAGTNPSAVDLVDAQQRLSPRITGARADYVPVGNARWSMGLRLDGAEPAGWEVTHLPWDTHRDRWLRIVSWARARVDQALAGDRPPPACVGRPLTWGGTMGVAVEDKTIMVRRNAARVRRGLEPLRRLDCGRTRNIFWGHAPRSRARVAISQLHHDISQPHREIAQPHSNISSWSLSERLVVPGHLGFSPASSRVTVGVSQRERQ